VNRAEKVNVAEQLHESFAQTPHIIVTSFRGLSVNQATELRRQVRAAGGSYRVIKNRIAKRAAAGTAMEKLSENLTGPCAVAAHESDPVSLAKALQTFVKDNPQLELLAGIVDATAVLDAQGVEALSKLPGLPELRAQLLALIQTPAQTLVRLIGTPGTQIARVIDAHRESQGGGD
jgi:large subunit ribosomal protein L10